MMHIYLINYLLKLRVHFTMSYSILNKNSSKKSVIPWFTRFCPPPSSWDPNYVPRIHTQLNDYLQQISALERVILLVNQVTYINQAKTWSQAYLSFVSLPIVFYLLSTMAIAKDLMYHKFRAYGFLKNLRFFDPFIILFFRDASLSFLQIGVLFSVREIAINVLEVPTGVIADAFGRRRAMLAAFTSYLVSFALFYLFGQFAVYAIAMVFFAFGEAFRSGTHKAMILEHLQITGIEHMRVEYYGHTRAASQFGSAVAALIAAGLVLYSGNYRIVFAASIVPYILGLLLIASYPKALDGEGTSAGKERTSGLGARILKAIKESGRMLLRLDLLRGIASAATFDSLFKTTKDYLQPILELQALSLPILVTIAMEKRTAIIVGVVYFVIYLGTCYTSSHANAVVQRARSVPRAASFIYVVGMALLVGVGMASWQRLSGVAITGFLGFYLAYNLRRPMIIGYLAELIPRQSMATGLSIESQARSFLTAALAPVIGFLADRYGVGPALAIVGGMGLVLVPFLSLRERNRPRPA